jgi:hypothetical protein
MIADFTDFCTWVYCLVDDFVRPLAPLLGRTGPEPACSDAEVIAMAVIGECRGWHRETELLAHFREHTDLFPRQLTQSRFNRRRRALGEVLALIHRAVVDALDWSAQAVCLIDSMPVAVVQFHNRGKATRVEWEPAGAAIGYNSTKRRWFFGYKLHVLATADGVILNYTLTGADVHDGPASEDLLFDVPGRTVLGDKAYYAKPRLDELKDHGVTVLCKRQKNYKDQLPPDAARFVDHYRQRIESINSQLTEQFGADRSRAKTAAGFRARLRSKLLGHVLCVYINRLTGSAEPRKIKRLAFPN